jgi:hypothetical protein
MKLSSFVLLLSVLLGTASAQAERNPLDGASQAVSEQRRAELREALKAQRGSQPVTREPQVAGSVSNRHLSAQEREDLRQQLRQQRH